MLVFLLVLQALVAAALIAVILAQKSEGGGLGTGGSPTGFLSARGAADFMTRSTAVLASVFVALCVALAVVASMQHKTSAVDTSAVSTTAPTGATPGALPTGPSVPVGGGAPLNPVQGLPNAGLAPTTPVTSAPVAPPPATAPAQGVPVQK